MKYMYLSNYKSKIFFNFKVIHKSEVKSYYKNTDCFLFYDVFYLTLLFYKGNI